ncbi:MAG: GTP pyrophosphokinase family protein [Lachnospiraceae bacterium]|nr:GTP pyrophosphokinase family protein [Lachnospiraceae bacterium]
MNSRTEENYYLARLLDEDDKGILEREARFNQIMMMYSCGIREVTTKLEILNDDLKARYQRNPIHSIKSRIKSPVSIAKKLKKKGNPVCVESIRDNLNDVAGVRVICSFIDDIYTITEMLTSQTDITLVKLKDYIEHPKPNGYRSLHLIIEVPVFFADRMRPMKVEVQIRTIAMDYWASLDHQLRYKKDDLDEHVRVEMEKRLRRCADVISETDMEMLDIRKNIYGFRI